MTSKTTTNTAIQNLLLFIAICMFPIGMLVQIGSSEAPDSAINIRYISLQNTADILPLQDTQVSPVAYTDIKSLQQLPVAEKKEKFIAMLLPAILIAKQQLQDQRLRVETLLQQTSLTTQEQRWLEQLQQRYKVKDAARLPARMIAVPNSLVLAQAAIETGWGSSRFFLQGNNVFGVWSYNPDEPRMKARESRAGKAVYVKRYPSLLQAIDDYLLTLGRGKPYKDLRQATETNQNSLILIQHLQHYSELGQEYIQRLSGLIRHNKLQRFDSYQLKQG